MFTNLAQYDFVGHLHIIGKSSPNGKFVPLLSILNTGKPLWKPNKKHQPKGGSMVPLLDRASTVDRSCCRTSSRWKPLLVLLGNEEVPGSRCL